MMEFITIPTEQTTAVTDVVFGIMAVTAALYLHRIGKKDRQKAALWVWIFALLALAAFLGAITHGIKMSATLQTLLWYPLYLSLGLLVAFFMVAVIYDLRGQTMARRILPTMMTMAAVFFGITLIWPDNFLIFIIYKAAAMLFALGGYIWMTFRGHPGAGLVAMGILTTIIAAGAQAWNTLSFNFIWEFDHNGIYHLIQMIGIGFLLAGQRKALLSCR